MKVCLFKILIGLIYFIGITIIFNRFAYEIDQFNSKLRNFLFRGEFSLRKFKDGIPYSISPKLDSFFVSPFYVVHYGLIYSKIYKESYQKFGLHWSFDKTLDLWNEKPPVIKSEFFIKLSDWIVDNVRLLNGRYHLIYNFDWPYKGYVNNSLKAPWYSGLTDGYAIVLLLRAYDVTKNVKYLDVADKLYLSTITPIFDGGSLNFLDGKMWIEEYVDPKIGDYSKMSYVLNGMIYGTYGIISYEYYRNIKDGYSKNLIESIFFNLDKFYHSGWSFYDLIGNSSNLKYHRIHKALLDELIEFTKFMYPDIYEKYCNKIEYINSKWTTSYNNLGFFYILYGEKSFTYFHFLGFYILLFFSFIIFLGKF